MKEEGGKHAVMAMWFGRRKHIAIPYMILDKTNNVMWYGQN
jgi:hypothetical protein